MVCQTWNLLRRRVVTSWRKVGRFAKYIWQRIGLTNLTDWEGEIWFNLQPFIVHLWHGTVVEAFVYFLLPCFWRTQVQFVQETFHMDYPLIFEPPFHLTWPEYVSESSAGTINLAFCWVIEFFQSSGSHVACHVNSCHFRLQPTFFRLKRARAASYSVSFGLWSHPCEWQQHGACQSGGPTW